MKRILAVFLTVFVMASALIGCGEEKKITGTGNIKDVEYKFNEEASKYEDSSDMPDYAGEQLELRMWYGAGSYSAKGNNKSENDVVTPELARVTGVKFSDKSMDNGGEMQDAKLAKIIASKDWPDVLWKCQANVMDELIEQDLLWELSELIPKYMPNYYAITQKGEWMKSKRADGAVYEINMLAPVDYVYPDMKPEILARNEAPRTKTSYVMVRDDILKKIKPEALTQDEILEIFKKNGKFTEEEILNAAFNSKEEFYQFMRDIKALGLTAGNREVYATYAFAGSDNWDFLTVFAGGLNGFNSSGGGPMNNYFTYFDVETGKIEYMFKQDFFKEEVRELTKLIQENVICQDSIIDSRATFEEKCATGQYAILYGTTAPDINTLNQNAQGYKYRKVILNIPWNESKFMAMRNSMENYGGYAFLKNQISEDEIAQVLRYFDFMLTDVGQKLVQWGPKSAGLFEEKENGRRFVNKEVEEGAVYGVANGAQLKYGLANRQWPGYPDALNKWQPIYIYDSVPNLAKLNNFFSTGVYDPIEFVQSTDVAIYTLNQYVPEALRFWDARTAYENALTKTLTAKDDAEFDALWQAMIDVAERNGLTDETLGELNTAWTTITNKEYMHNVEEYLKAHK